MASAVATPNVEIFKGTGWEECETFIRNIRAAAWKEDKVEDDRWTANYASLHLSGRALKWHSRLPPDIRRDWSKLEVALLDKWPSPDGSDDEDSARAPITPTPAAAPYSSNINVNQSPRYAVVKVISIKSNTIFYLGMPTPNFGGACCLTKDIGNALHVSVDAKANPHILEASTVPGSPRHRYSWVGIHWSATTPRIQPGSGDWGRVVLIDSITMKSSFTSDFPSIRVIAWDISEGGDVRLAWFQDNQKTLLDMFISEEELEITIGADSNTYGTNYPEESRARLVLQPVI